MNETASSTDTTEHDDDKTRRDFLIITTSALGAVGAGLAAWPLIDSMNPAADTLAVSTSEISLDAIEVGQSITAIWRGKPIFIRHRTEAEIKAARDVKMEDLIDPASDEDRVQKAEWLIQIGICTHLGCIPKGQKEGDPKGDYNGWFCPCHGSHYDTAGRIRKGPAPLNLVLPPYQFLEDTLIKIG